MLKLSSEIWVVTAVKVSILVFWIVSPCGLVDYHLQDHMGTIVAFIKSKLSRIRLEGLRKDTENLG
jgi:fumarate reductase subunit D